MPLQGAGQTHGSNIYLIGGHASRDVENLQSWANTWSCPHNNNFQSASAQSPRCRKGFEALFCFHSFFFSFYSYTKLHHFFLIPGMERAVFSTLFRKRWQSTAQPSSFRRQGRARFRGAKHLFFVCMKLLESDSRCHIMNHMLLRALPSRPVRLVRSCS